jgi:hypothetical protein
MLGLKVNNLAEAIGHSKKLEQTSLKYELDRLNEQSKRSRLTNERHKATFTIDMDKKHKAWWNSDEFVRDYFQVDFEDVLSKRLKNRLNSEQLIHKLKQQQLKQLQIPNDKKRKSETGAANKKQQQLIRDTDLLIKKLDELKFPELKEKLIEEYQRKAQHRLVRNTSKNLPPLNKDSKLFMDCAERFLNHKPYDIENHDKINIEQYMSKVKEKVHEKEKSTLKKCEERFDKIITAFENDKQESTNGYNSYYNYYDD